MKEFIVLLFFILCASRSTISIQSPDYNETDSDIIRPLISKSDTVNVLDSDVISRRSENDLKGCFSILLRKILCLKDNRYNTDAITKNDITFISLSTDILSHIALFLDPISIINLGMTNWKYYKIFSNNYWEKQCQAAKLEPWNNNLTPVKIYVCYFWHRTQVVELLKKAASLGHPESKHQLEEIQERQRLYYSQNNKPKVYSSHQRLNRIIHKSGFYF